MTSNHALRHQLERARHLQAARRPTAAAEAAVVTMPSGVDRARYRALERRLPPPRAASYGCSGRLTAGRVKLPADLREQLGFAPGTQVTVAVLGPQLLVASEVPGTALDGAPATIDVHGRLQLSAGQRQVFGVDAAATVLLLADLDAGVLRIVDPARVHTLLDELTPVAATTDEQSDTASVSDATTSAATSAAGASDGLGFRPRLVMTEGA